MFMTRPTALLAAICATVQGVGSAGRPTLIGIDGAGCAGKSTLADALETALGSATSTNLGLDGFFVPFEAQNPSYDPREDLARGVPHLCWGRTRSRHRRLASGSEARYGPTTGTATGSHPR
jgi:hypothetical protein